MIIFARKLSAFVNPSKRNILLVDNQDSFTFNLVQLFRELNCQVTVSSISEECLYLLPQFNRIVFSPGPGLPVDFPVMTEILKRINEHSKILGICLGHQAIAEFFGAKLFRQECVQHGQKKQIIKSRNFPHSCLVNLPDKFIAGLYHSWAVLPASVPDALGISCISEDGIVMGIVHRTLAIEGLQFHPESYMSELGSMIIKNWLHDE